MGLRGQKPVNGKLARLPWVQVRAQKEVIDRLLEDMGFIKRYSTEKPFSELNKFHAEVGQIAIDALAFAKEKLG